MFRVLHRRSKQETLADELPWDCLVAPGVVLQKDGALQKTFRLRGPDVTPHSRAERASLKRQLNAVLMRHGTGWAFFYEAARRECGYRSESSWPNLGGWICDVEREQVLAQGQQFSSDYYLTVVHKPVRRMTSKLARVLFQEESADRSARSRYFGDRVKQFVEAVRSTADSLKSVFLGVHELSDSETYTYLKSTISTVKQKVECPAVPDCMDYYLSDETFIPGLVPVLGNRVMLTCTVRGFPKLMDPYILDELNTLSLQYRWVSRYFCLGAEDSEAIANEYRKGFAQKAQGLGAHYGMLDASRSELGGLQAQEALKEIAADQLMYGYLTTTVSVWGPEVDETRANMQRVVDVLRAKGLVVSVDPFGSSPAWFGSHPGNVTRNVRRYLVSTENLSDMMPIGALWQGDEENAHMRRLTRSSKRAGDGSAHITCSTIGATPFYLNLNDKDVGNTWIVGSVGGGKSTLLSMLAISWQKYPGAHVIFLDIDRTSRAATLAMGGRMLDLGDGNARCALQPLRELETGQQRSDALRFVIDLFEAQGVAVTPTMHSHIAGAIESLINRRDKSQRTVTQLSNYLSTCAREYERVLAPYCRGGAYGQLFDANEPAMSDERWLALEMRHLLELPEDALGPALLYVARRVRRMCSGRPTLLLIDEAHRYLKFAKFREFFVDALTTLRKKNVFVVFSTPGVTHVSDDPGLYKVVRDCCPTTIYLPNPNLADPEVRAQYEGLGLGEASIFAIERLQSKREYYFSSVRGKQVFSMELGPAQLAFAGMCTDKDHRFLDAMERDVPSERWAEAMLHYRGVEWAEQLVADKRKELAA